jgi:hypothetical protein
MKKILSIALLAAVVLLSSGVVHAFMSDGG